MQKLKKTRKNNKAVSTVIAVLLMIAIAVLVVFIAYAWIMGYINFSTTQTGRAIQIQSVGLVGDKLLIYVQNVGHGTVNFDPDQTVYINSILKSSIIESSDRALADGETATINVTGQDGLAGQTVTIRVVTLEGTIAEITTTLPGTSVITSFITTYTTTYTATFSSTATTTSGSGMTTFSTTTPITTSTYTTTSPSTSTSISGTLTSTYTTSYITSATTTFSSTAATTSTSGLTTFTTTSPVTTSTATTTTSGTTTTGTTTTGTITSPSTTSTTSTPITTSTTSTSPVTTVTYTSTQTSGTSSSTSTITSTSYTTPSTSITTGTSSSVITTATTSTSTSTTQTYTITASAGPNGQISPFGTVIVNYGASQTFTIAANGGYKVFEGIVDGVSQGTITSYTFTNVQANHVITASFVTQNSLISNFNGDPWDYGWNDWSNPPWRTATDRYRSAPASATCSARNPSDYGPFTSNSVNTAGANAIRISFWYMVRYTDSANDLRLYYSGKADPDPSNREPPYGSGYDSWTRVQAPNFAIGRPSNDMVWYHISFTIGRTSGTGDFVDASAFTSTFRFSILSDLSYNAGGLTEQVWVDDICIELIP